MYFAQPIQLAINAYRISRVPQKGPQHIELLRKQRLKRLLRHAVRAPFFRDKYRGVNLEQCELSHLPTTNKSELMTHFDQTVTDPSVRRVDIEAFVNDHNNLGRLFLGRYAVSHTSGSQGQSLLLLQDRQCLQILFSIMAARASALGRPTLREAIRRLCSPARVAVVTVGQRGFYPSGVAFEFMPCFAGSFIRVAHLSQMQADLIEQLNHFQPTVIAAYPFVLERLALQAERVKLTGLRQFTSSGEHLSDRARARIQAAFGVPIFDHYGMGECLFLGEGCPTDGGAHLNADWAILEVLDSRNRPVPPGQPGAKVLVTNLANTIQPIIRYEVGDIVRFANHRCTCGSELPWIERIDGRSTDVFWVGENKDQMIACLLFKHVFDTFLQIRDWQAVQVERNRVEFCVEVLPGVVLEQETAERFVVHRLRELGLPDLVKVNVRIVSALKPDTTTGKFRRMISMVDSSSGLSG